MTGPFAGIDGRATNEPPASAAVAVRVGAP